MRAHSRQQGPSIKRSGRSGDGNGWSSESMSHHVANNWVADCRRSSRNTGNSLRTSCQGHDLGPKHESAKPIRNKYVFRRIAGRGWARCTTVMNHWQGARRLGVEKGQTQARNQIWYHFVFDTQKWRLTTTLHRASSMTIRVQRQLWD